jgi:hypothetical protein
VQDAISARERKSSSVHKIRFSAVPTVAALFNSKRPLSI